jgi:aminoglycoside/choline kinase family phosphotransferase
MASLGTTEKALGSHFPPGTRIIPLKGDASTRRFCRIALPDSQTRILMIYPEPFVWEGSPLESSHRHLEAIGVPVPEIERVFPEQGAVLLEDLGDTTLQMALRSGSTLDRSTLYHEAIRIIVLLQDRGTRELPPEAPARQSALDEEKFLWELNHFYEHFVVGYRGARPISGDEALFRAFFAWLAKSLDGVPRVLCHRDFQARNLMVTAQGLRVIDYQDARLGPASYDPASLLRDSSLDLDQEFREEGIVYFLSLRRELSPEEFRSEFTRQALQRNIKDLGTFGRLVHSQGQDAYREYIPRTLRMVRDAMLREQRYHGIFPLFERYVFSPAGE